jgi:hypothetical protein
MRRGRSDAAFFIWRGSKKIDPGGSCRPGPMVERKTLRPRSILLLGGFLLCRRLLLGGLLWSGLLCGLLYGFLSSSFFRSHVHLLDD